MKQLTRLALSAQIALVLLTNWWGFYEGIWMDEVNHALFGVLLFRLLGKRAIDLAPIVAIGWEVWEL